MCQKSSQAFKQFYAVMLTSHNSTRSLQVFKTAPTKEQLNRVVVNHVIGKVESVPHMYADRPRIEVVPIHIPYHILY